MKGKNDSYLFLEFKGVPPIFDLILKTHFLLKPTGDSDEYFKTKRCGRVDLAILNPAAMPESMQDRAPRTHLKTIRVPDPETLMSSSIN